MDITTSVAWVSEQNRSKLRWDSHSWFLFRCGCRQGRAKCLCCSRQGLAFCRRTHLPEACVLWAQEKPLQHQGCRSQPFMVWIETAHWRQMFTPGEGHFWAHESSTVSLQFCLTPLRSLDHYRGDTCMLQQFLAPLSSARTSKSSWKMEFLNLNSFSYSVFGNPCVGLGLWKGNGKHILWKCSWIS